MYRALFERSLTATALLSALQTWAIQLCVMLIAGALFELLRSRRPSLGRTALLPGAVGYFRAVCAAYALAGGAIVVFVVIRMHSWSSVTATDLLQFLMDRGNFVFIGVLDDGALILFLLLAVRGGRLLEPARAPNPAARRFGLTVVLVCATLLTILAAQRLFNTIPSLRNAPSPVLAVQAPAGHPVGLEFVAWLLWVVVAVPVSEELCFRGILYSGYRSVAGWVPALFLQAAIFVALHVQSGQLATITVAALAFGLAYEATGSIRVPMVAHGLLNLCAVLRIA